MCRYLHIFYIKKGIEMIYTENTKKAMKIAYKAHSGQMDKGGVPYIYHPMHIAERMDDELSTVIALLHDVIEDTYIRYNDLKDEQISQEAIEIIKILTRNKDEDYFEYINRVGENSIARKIKIEDLIHNSDLTRLDVIDDESLKRVEKYNKALKILNNK